MAVCCHYLIQVKTNCSKLYLYLRLLTAECTPVDVHQTYDNKRGREEWRKYEVFLNNYSHSPKEWNGIHRVIKVTREGIRNKKFYFEESFFILSKPIDDAKIIGEAIRNHWFIENKVHWVRDVFLKEDKMWIKKSDPAAKIAFFNTLALNLLKLSEISSVKDACSLFTNNVKELRKLFLLNWVKFRT